jgi:tetratricopeptide (TPR) repeat protein
MGMQFRQPVEVLDYPAFFFYQAAEGWIELGNLKEALEELDQIGSPGRTHWAVLHLRWSILSKLKKWDRCLVVGRALTAGYPRDPCSWRLLAETYYLMGDFEKAYRVAAANAADFPNSWNLLYDAACYSCLIGKFEEAQRYFNMALDVGDSELIRQQALDDPELKALWNNPSPRSRRKAAT